MEAGLDHSRSRSRSSTRPAGTARIENVRDAADKAGRLAGAEGARGHAARLQSLSERASEASAMQQQIQKVKSHARGTLFLPVAVVTSLDNK